MRRRSERSDLCTRLNTNETGEQQVFLGNRESRRFGPASLGVNSFPPTRVPLRLLPFIYIFSSRIMTPVDEGFLTH